MVGFEILYNPLGGNYLIKCKDSTACVNESVANRGRVLKGKLYLMILSAWTAICYICFYNSG